MFAPPDPTALDSLVLTFAEIEPLQDPDAPSLIRVPVEIVVPTAVRSSPPASAGRVPPSP